MSKQHVSIDIAGDLRTLPLPAEELWVRAPRPETSLRAQLIISAVALIAVAVVVLPLLAPVPEQPGTPGPVATTPPRVTPPPAQATARPWSARTPAEVLANLPGDQNFPSAIARLSSGVEPDPRAVGRTPSIGTPIYVRGLRPGDANEYIVPVNVGDTTIALMKIGVDANELGRLDAIRGWSATPSFPPTSQAAAIARGSSPADPVIKAEFVWTNIRGSADELQPFWILTRASGVALLLLEDGTLVSASEAGL